ncbi:MAG: hypothetical protein QXV47_07340 [Fervidicoccaceae archaeon]
MIGYINNRRACRFSPILNAYGGWIGYINNGRACRFSPILNAYVLNV